MAQPERWPAVTSEKRLHIRRPVILLVCLAVLALSVGALAIVVLGNGGGEIYEPSFADKITEGEPVYIFGVHPLHNPQRLNEVYQPVVDYINARIHGARLTLEASRSYAAFEEKLLKERKFGFALPNPYQMVLSTEAGYRIFGQMSNEGRFRGLLIVRADSGIKVIGDLKGKVVAYPAPTALGATMMPQYYIHTHGLDVRKDIRNIYVGSQESSIMSAYLGNSAAAATWPGPWELFAQSHPEIARELVVRWETPPMPNNGLVVRDDMPEALVEEVSSLLFGLHRTEEGRAIMARVGVPRFDPASEDTYQPVRDFLARYREAIGDVPQ